MGGSQEYILLDFVFCLNQNLISEAHAYIKCQDSLQS